MNRTQNQPTVTGADTPAQVLRDAVLYLERHGWHQGDLYGDHTILTPPACAAGAIRCAVVGGPFGLITTDQKSQFDRILTVLAGHVHDTTDDDPNVPAEAPIAIVGDWNDATGRAVEQVIATLRAAADDWDRIHGGAR